MRRGAAPAAKLRVCLARKIRRTDAGSLPALVRMRSRLQEHAQERGGAPYIIKLPAVAR
jgi:hypothetical protein